MNTSEKTTTFEANVPRLRALAYRLTGSVSETEDLLQEARIRWLNVAQSVDNPGAYLGKMVTRLALDWLRSARVRREEYVGPWLPEPLMDTRSVSVETAGELAADVSMALMLTLERLSPLERAAFLLHDVFDFDYAEIAETLGREEPAVRKLAQRGRARVRERRPRFQPTGEQTQRVLTAFQRAATRGETEALQRVLADDVVFYTDGGGKVSAALLPIRGADKVARFVVNVQRKWRESGLDTLVPADVNGMPGFLQRKGDVIYSAGAFQIVDGRIVAIFAVRNPDKLRHIN
jgi:RNA polymerase sigma-70 factor (ECF subfamily)